MMEKVDSGDLRWAWGLVLGCAAFRFVFAHFFPLAPDEANYWQWSRYLDWGYHDQAPLIAWAIRLGTLLLGDTEPAIRLPSVVGMTVAALYLVSMADRWTGGRTALATALLTQGIFEFQAGGLLATPDGLQAAAWAGAAYHTARAYENDARAQWIAAGVWFGVGLLAKFTMILFAPLALAYGLSSRTHRRRLAGFRPYAGAAAGALLFSPVLFWNAANHWNSLRHVAYIGGAEESFGIHWKFLGDYVGSQAGLLSPLVFLLVVAAWIAVIRKRYPAERWIYPYLAFLSFPVFAFFALLSLHSRVYGNWPGAGFLTAAVLVAALYGARPAPNGGPAPPGWGRRLFPWAVATSGLLTVLALLHTAWFLLPIPVSQDRVAADLCGWRELSARVHGIAQAMPRPEKTFLFGVNYQTASELAFYAPGKPRTVSINRWTRPNVYDYWWKETDLLGWDAVGATYEGYPHAHAQQLLDVFARVDPPLAMSVFRPSIWRGPSGVDPAPVRTFALYRAYGFKGGTRWIPEKTGDIRAF